MVFTAMFLAIVGGFSAIGGLLTLILCCIPNKLRKKKKHHRREAASETSDEEADSNVVEQIRGIAADVSNRQVREASMSLGEQLKRFYDHGEHNSTIAKLMNRTAIIENLHNAVAPPPALGETIGAASSAALSRATPSPLALYALPLLLLAHFFKRVLKL